MKRAWSALLVPMIFACSDDPSTDAGTNTDAGGADTGVLDTGVADTGIVGDAATFDSGVVDAGADAGVLDSGVGGEGVTFRLAHMAPIFPAVDLCIFREGANGPPTRLTTTVGRPQGIAFGEVSARFEFAQPLVGLAPIAVVTSSSADCSNPIFSTSLSGDNPGLKLLFLLENQSLTNMLDDAPAPVAGDLLRYTLDLGPGGNMFFAPASGPEANLVMTYAEYTMPGTFIRRDIDMMPRITRSYTPLAGGAASIFAYLEFNDVGNFIHICDDRAPPANGLTPCGPEVRQ